MLSLALPSRGSAHTQCGHSVLCFIFEVVLMSDSSCYASLFSERPGHCHVWIKLILAILRLLFQNGCGCYPGGWLWLNRSPFVH